MSCCADLAISVYTTWAPKVQMSEEEITVAHRKSLEQRWKAGAMNVKQLYDATGGGRMRTMSDHPYAQGNLVPIAHPDIPGLGLTRTHGTRIH